MKKRLASEQITYACQSRNASAGERVASQVLRRTLCHRRERVFTMHGRDRVARGRGLEPSLSYLQFERARRSSK